MGIFLFIIPPVDKNYGRRREVSVAPSDNVCKQPKTKIKYEEKEVTG